MHLHSRGTGGRVARGESLQHDASIRNRGRWHSCCARPRTHRSLTSSFPVSPSFPLPLHPLLSSPSPPHIPSPPLPTSLLPTFPSPSPPLHFPSPPLPPYLPLTSPPLPSSPHLDFPLARHIGRYRSRPAWRSPQGCRYFWILTCWKLSWCRPIDWYFASWLQPDD